MGNFLHSERMTLCQIFIPSEAAYFVISELGEIGVVQFRDLNKDVTSFQRNFVDDVRRCHEMERKLRYIKTEAETHNLFVEPYPEVAKALSPNEIADLELHISKSEDELKKLSQNAHSLRKCLLELQQLKHVLEKSEIFLRKRDEIFGFDGSKNVSEDLQTSTMVNQLSVVTGIINREKVKTFETMLWRVSKGNIFFERVDIEKPLEDLNADTKEYKTVFIVCFHGSLLTPRINKICEGFRATLYTCPVSPQERKKLLEKITRRLDDIKMVINQTFAFRENFLIQVAKDLSHWCTMVSKIKAIYHILNFLNMDVTGKCFVGQCWVPFGYIPTVKKALADGSRASGCPIFSFLYVVRTDEEPPTYYRTNKFTQCFQKMIDVYGVSSYQEVNPALFSIVTFPFLFAVMFGDIGHALILLVLATYMILKEKNIQTSRTSNEIFHIVFAGRYLILLMGVFSLYTGAIYNELFSKSVNIFGSSWYRNFTTIRAFEANLDPQKDYVGSPYFVGVDPIWAVSSNRITFLNSYKMKVSIIFGVFHMILGLCSNVINYVCSRKYVYIFLDFIPKLVLLSCLFLWLIAMMFLKWFLFSSQNEDPRYGPFCAPSILILFINMVLRRETNPHSGCKPYFFEYQPNFQNILICSALITIPVMLLGKPLYLMVLRRHRSHPQKNVHDELSLKFHKSVDNNLNLEEKSETLTDIFITEVIGTIEYVLGTVSHTASYLRLWALSLAHSELSHILWSRVLSLGLKIHGSGGGLVLFVTFSVWAFFTISILVVMEGLSAFLHTLRLHWVEFMSKFYEGKGYLFEPFSFKEIFEHQKEKQMEEDEDEEEEDMGML